MIPFRGFTFPQKYGIIYPVLNKNLTGGKIVC